MTPHEPDREPGWTSHVVSRRMILDEGGAGRVLELVDDLGLTLVSDEGPDPESSTSRKVTWELSTGLYLQYIEDQDADCGYAFLVGDDESAMERFTLLLERYLRPESFDGLLAGVESARSDLGRLSLALLRAGLGTPVEFDQRFFNVIAGAMRHDDRGVRLAALWATTYSFWREYRGPLAEVAEADPDREIRATAQDVLETNIEFLGPAPHGDDGHTREGEA